MRVSYTQSKSCAVGKFFVFLLEKKANKSRIWGHTLSLRESCFTKELLALCVYKHYRGRKKRKNSFTRETFLKTNISLSEKKVLEQITRELHMALDLL